MNQNSSIQPRKGDMNVAPKFFLPYQAKWIKDNSKLKLMEKSRQIGLSWSTAYRLVREKSKVGVKFDAWVSSRDDIQARLFLEDCKAFAQIFQIAGEDLGLQVIDPERKISAYVLQFANGVRINSMSSNPDAQAGKRGDRVLDEFALHPDPRKLYAIAYPGITWGGSMEIISTHRGSNNLFNELVQEIKFKGNPKKISLHTVTLQDALDQGFLEKLKAKLREAGGDDERLGMDEAQYFEMVRSGCPDEETFQQEYMCNPQDDNSAFLSYDLIRGCEYKANEPWEYTLAQLAACGNPLYLGVDVGRKHDLTVMWLDEKVGDTSFTRRLIELKNKTFDAQEFELYQLLSLPNLRRACIDSSGIGRQFAERAQQRFGTYKVEAVTFTGPVKEELAYPLRASFEDRTNRIPSSEFIRADLRAVKKETTSSGNIRFTADRGKNGHADRFWARALALHAGKMPESNTMPQRFTTGNATKRNARRDRRNRRMIG
jgi:phage FluMu gp28-like protein